MADKVPCGGAERAPTAPAASGSRRVIWHRARMPEDERYRRLLCALQALLDLPASTGEREGEM
jgi:hypothetical protein